MPLSLTRYRSLSTTSGDGVSGAPRINVHATCVLVTSPAPSGRTAMNDGMLNPPEMNSSPAHTQVA